jgi:hypothetical protein
MLIFELVYISFMDLREGVFCRVKFFDPCDFL